MKCSLDYSWTSPKQAIRGFMFGDMCERSWSSWSYMFIFAWILTHLVMFILDTFLYLINSPFSKYFKLLIIILLSYTFQICTLLPTHIRTCIKKWNQRNRLLPLVPLVPLVFCPTFWCLVVGSSLGVTNSTCVRFLHILTTEIRHGVPLNAVGQGYRLEMGVS